MKAPTSSILRPVIRLVIAAVCCLQSGETLRATDADRYELWFDKPAEKWNQALPVGNGSLGAMIFGGLERDRLQLNDDTLWTGSPHNYAHPGAHEYLSEIRNLLFAGKQREAERLAGEHFMSQPLRQMTYQPCADLVLDFASHGVGKNYRRSLDLRTAVATTEYTVDGTTFRRECFSSYPAQALVVRLSASQPQALTFSASVETKHVEAQVESADSNTLLLQARIADAHKKNEGTVPNLMKFAVHLQVLDTDGSVRIEDGTLYVDSATQATLVLTTGTNYSSYLSLDADPVAESHGVLQHLRDKTYEDLKAEHLADYQGLFQQVSLDLGEPAEPSLPTDQRVLRNETKPEPALAALLFDYGRYLMITSSRPGSQPANLQGIWNDELDPPWGSKYTVNINTEMNYWLVESCGLAECAEPLYAMLTQVAESGTRTAQEHYALPGWVLHHNTDLWRGTAPINASNHGIWPTGGAWLCQHLWWHYLYSEDREFLAEHAYPLMKEASRFFADYLVEDAREGRNWLISGPSNSPEQGGLVMGPTMDHQIIRHLFSSTIEAAKILNVDETLATRLEKLLPRIAPNQIGRLGQLQEWLEDVDDPDNRHRHVSHLWGVYPGEEITPRQADLFQAARKSLEMRGNGGTGWSRAWKINLWARFRDGEQAHEVLSGLLKLSDSSLTEYTGGGVYPNLFDVHPPFQIDGNFGATSGIVEMLVQSHQKSDDGKWIVDLLPALPPQWREGQVTGLRCRSGLEADVAWREGRVAKVVFRSPQGGEWLVQAGDKTAVLSLQPGAEQQWDGELHGL